MSRSTRAAAAFLTACICAPAAVPPPVPWVVARTADFEVYTDAGPAPASATLAWFEELRAFFAHQTGLPVTAGPPVRVIVFRSAQEYSPFRPRPGAAAFYAGTGASNYIVMEQSHGDWAGIAAHEYAHCLMHANGVTFPRWLNEGLAEVFSTVRIGRQASTIGTSIPSRIQTLRRVGWLPLQTLLAVQDDAGVSTQFYAESWALAHMLVFSPEYRPRLASLVTSRGALDKTYGKPLEAIAQDLHSWIDDPAHFEPVAVTGVPNQTAPPAPAAISSFEQRRLIAGLLFTEGDYRGAGKLYEELRREAPTNPEIAGALGEVALHEGDKPATLRAWRQAIDLGTRDAKLCYRYVGVAQQTGATDAEIRPILERAVALDPSLDEARYQLALMQINSGEFDAGVKQLRAVRHVPPSRAYSYWSAMANALNELDRREEAKTAAAEAARHASTPEEHTHAAQLAYIANTDMTVQFERDASGNARMVTTRKAHGAADWNPFVEPGDRMRRIEGTLGNIDCSGPVTRIGVQAGGEALTLSIPDPSRVRMLNAPPEFTCGPQSAHVVVDYATQNGTVRSIDFR